MKFTKKLFSKLALFIFIMAFIAVFTSVFSAENSYIGVAIVTGLTMFNVIDLYIPYKKSPFLITGLFMLIGVSAYLSNLNPFLGFFINFFTIIIFLTPTSVKMEFKAYMPFILCYIFIQSNPVPDSHMPMRLLSLFVGGLLVSGVYVFYHRKTTYDTSILSLYKLLNPNTLHFQFIMRMALGEAIAMFLGDFFNIPRYMWIALTIMSLTQPFYANTKERIKYRFAGTIIGALVFSVIFKQVIPDEYLAVCFLILNYIYSFITDYKVQMVFITVNSLNAAMILFDTKTSIFLRIIMICSGIVIAHFINNANVYATHHYFLRKLKKEEEEQRLLRYEEEEEGVTGLPHGHQESIENL